jgi:hypothetical protein
LAYVQTTCGDYVQEQGGPKGFPQSQECQFSKGKYSWEVRLGSGIRTARGVTRQALALSTTPWPVIPDQEGLTHLLLVLPL